MATHNTGATQKISSVGNVRADALIDSGERTHAEGKSVSIVDLNFRYTTLYEEAPEVLSHVTLDIEPGSKCLLLGSNGAGKTTLLNLMSGKHIHPAGAVVVLGQPAFHNTHPGIVAITGNWATTQAYGNYEVPYTKDIAVQEMINQIPAEDRDAARVAEIVEVLDIDLTWRMHIVSDGQRRRVQLLMGLMKPFQVLLLDEVTVDLDVVARSDLLTYLSKECDTRGATIIYATHIFDGLERWATHFARINRGQLVQCSEVNGFAEYKALMDAKAKSPLLKTVMGWLREEKAQFSELKRKERAEELDAPIDLKLSKYTPGIPFAHNRHHNASSN